LETKSNESWEEEAPPEKPSTLINKSYELTNYLTNPLRHT
jgi:hypothetical protein